MNTQKCLHGTLLMGLFAVLIAMNALGEAVKLDVSVDTPAVLAQGKPTAHLKVALTGGSIDSGNKRPPLNVCLVIDRSGSMSGEKLEKAKISAIMALERLNSEDIVSLVTYDTTVQVLVPATRASDRGSIAAAINSITPGNSTALFAGVSKGMEEIRKFYDRSRVNRIVLLSDGIANVGPSSPEQLASLGVSLGREGIAVTTIGYGLGYNEDLMVQLAQASDGYHLFAETPDDVKTAFMKEFGDALTVVAQNIGITIQCAEGVRPVRALGRSADITGNTVRASVNQLYAQHTKYILLEMELPESAAGTDRQIATVNASYTNMLTNNAEAKDQYATVSYVADPAIVEARLDRDTAGEVVRQIANEKMMYGMTLFDEGRIDEATAWFSKNEQYLLENASRLNRPDLNVDARSNGSLTIHWNPGDWTVKRKELRDFQNTTKMQQ